MVFEVDRFDRDKHQAWSVVARGRCSMVDDPLLDEIAASGTHSPWAFGPRHLYLRLALDVLTRRRITLGEALPIVACQQ